MSGSPKIIAKKRLGQNFLNDSAVVRKIVASLNLDSTDSVLEIGCGTGVLTRHLCDKVSCFVGVELDSSLFTNLQSSFASARLLNKDILTLNLATLGEELQAPRMKFKVVGNLPYYISSPILEWMGQQAEQIVSATIMLQAEVADRLTAHPGSKEYGVLTLLTAYYFSSRRLFKVGPSAFWPRPKVDSAVVLLEPKHEKLLHSEQEAAFFRFVKQCFSQRRKTLRNCLKGTVDLDQLTGGLTTMGHSTEARAEQLSLVDFRTLFLELNQSVQEGK